MSGLIGSVLAQAQSLSAQTAAISATGKNLANVNNEQYARQEVNFSTSVTGGVQISSITSTRDALVDSQVRNELAVSNSLTAQSNTVAIVESILGEEVDTAADQASATGGTSATTSSGFAATLDNFFNAFSKLSSDPTEPAYKQQVYSTSQSLVDRLNYLSTNIAQTVSDVNTEMTSEVNQAQTLLNDIADLNAQIAKVEVTGDSALDMRDTREAKLEELSKLMTIKISNSAVGLGQFDVSATDTAGNSVTLVSAGRTSGTLSFDGTNISMGGATLKPAAGSLAGYQTVKNFINTASGQLDALAAQMVRSVNAIYGTASGGPNYFNPAGVTAGTIALSNTLTASGIATSTTSDTGANDITLAIAGLSSKEFSSTAVPTPDLIDGTFSANYNSLVTSVGQKVNSLQGKLENSELVYNTLVSQRESISGVSSNEEASNIIVFQRAFQGNARIISVMDNLLDIVANKLGNF